MYTNNMDTSDSREKVAKNFRQRTMESSLHDAVDTQKRLDPRAGLEGRFSGEKARIAQRRENIDAEVAKNTISYPKTTLRARIMDEVKRQFGLIKEDS